MKDFLIVLALFLGIILIGKGINSIPGCPIPESTMTDEQIEEWMPFAKN
jgi:hypothetical protein